MAIFILFKNVTTLLICATIKKCDFFWTDGTDRPWKHAQTLVGSIENFRITFFASC